MLSFLSCDTSAERLACVASASLAAGVFLSDAGTAVAVLGVLGAVLSSRDLVALYLILTPLSLLSDVIWLVTGHPGVLAKLLAILLLFVKAAGIWFAYDVFKSTDPGSAEAADYQPFGNPSPRVRDPFAAQQQQAQQGIIPPMPQQPLPPPPPQYSAVAQPAGGTPLPQPPSQRQEADLL